jgi:hypothetical protein
MVNGVDILVLLAGAGLGCLTIVALAVFVRLFL